MTRKSRRAFQLLAPAALFALLTISACTGGSGAGDSDKSASAKTNVEKASDPRVAAENLTRLASGGVGGWLNVTRPLTTEDMRGRPILLDFWTYGCINCMQIVPDLEYLEDKFGDKLLIIGVHSAKFENEKGSERILSAAKWFGLRHPVINDSDFAIWNSFKVDAWPTQVLLRPDGLEAARFVGEGNRAEIESAVAKYIPSVTNSSAIAPLIDNVKAGGTLSFPTRLAYDPTTATMFVADSGNNRILGFEAATGVVKYEIGTGERGLKDGGFDAARFNHLRGIAFADGGLYVADTDNHALRFVDLQKRTVETLAGNGVQGDDRAPRNAPALTTKLASPWDIEPLADGQTIAIAMAGHHQLWSYDTRAKTVSVLAGSGKEALGDSFAATATLAQPSGLSLADGMLYFADAESSALRVQYPDGRVETLIGRGLFKFGKVDGPIETALLQHAQGLFATRDKIYVADSYNDAVRIYDLQTKELTTLDKLQGLKEPSDVLLVDGIAWIADTKNHSLKKFDLTSGQTTTVELSLPK